MASNIAYEKLTTNRFISLYNERDTASTGDGEVEVTH